MTKDLLIERLMKIAKTLSKESLEFGIEILQNELKSRG
jgi:hypothetical protein